MVKIQSQVLPVYTILSVAFTSHTWVFCVQHWLGSRKLNIKPEQDISVQYRIEGGILLLMFKPWPSGGIVPRGQGSPKEEQTFFFFLFYLENKKGLVVGEGCSLAEQGSDLSFKPEPSCLLGNSHPLGWVWTPGQVHSVARVQQQHFIYTLQNTFVAPDVLFLLVLLCPSCETSKAEAGSSGDLTDLLQMKGPSHYKKKY